MDGLTVTITLNLNGASVPVTLDADALVAIAAALPDRSEGESPWLTGAEAAAAYLGWSRERVYKSIHRLPHYRDEGRLMFRRDELDNYLEQLRERR